MSFSRFPRSFWVASVALSVIAWAAHWPKDASGRLSGSPSTSDETLRSFLRDYLKDDLEGDAQVGREGLRYAAAFAELNNDGKKEALVYLETPHFCGSSGCPLLILSPQDSGYRVITEIPLTRLPVRMLTGSSHGWRDLGVRVQPGESDAGHETRFQFDGGAYSDTHSKLDERAPGEVLIPAFPAARKPANRQTK